MTARLTDKMISDYLSIGEVRLNHDPGVIRGVDSLALLREVHDRRAAEQLDGVVDGAAGETWADRAAAGMAGVDAAMAGVPGWPGPVVLLPNEPDELAASITRAREDDGMLADALAEVSRCREALEAIIVRATGTTVKGRTHDIATTARRALYGDEPVSGDFGLTAMAGPDGDA